MTQMENFSLDFNILNYTFFSKQVYELYKLLKDNLSLQNSQINQQEFLKSSTYMIRLLLFFLIFRKGQKGI